MLKWAFSKVIKVREKFAKDLKQEDVEKPFLEHLEDLRTMLVRIAMTLMVFVIVTFVFYQRLWSVATYPLALAGIQDQITFQQLEPVGGFMAVMNLSIVSGIVFSSPLLLFFILQFVLPGLRTVEKKVIFPALAVGGGLFILGGCFAYFLVAPRALTFFQDFNAGLSTTAGSGHPKPQLFDINLAHIKNFDWAHLPDMTVTVEAVPAQAAHPPIFWGISHYVKFICQFILIFGLCFELPVVVLALVKLDILSYQLMKGSRSYAVVGIAVISMIIAPSPDVMTLALIAGPLICLYEVCIWIAWWMEKRDRALYPEHYKALEEDAKLLAEDAAAWDDESYNPFGSDDDEDDDDLRPPPRTPPPGTQPTGGAASPTPTAHPAESVEHHPAPEAPAEVKPHEPTPPAHPPSEPDVPYGGGNHHPDEPNQD